MSRKQIKLISSVGKRIFCFISGRCQKLIDLFYIILNNSLDFNLINDLALAKNISQRKLFWEALQDTLHSQAIYSCTGDWKGAFEPIKIIKTSNEWESLWRKTIEMQQLEIKLNMDKKTVLIDILNAIGP